MPTKIVTHQHNKTDIRYNTLSRYYCDQCNNTDNMLEYFLFFTGFPEIRQRSSGWNQKIETSVQLHAILYVLYLLL